MTAIYKYELGFEAQGRQVHECTVPMPKNAEILHIRFWDGEISLWAKIRTDDTEQTKTFYVHPTGEFTLSPSAKYVQTVFDETNTISWHVYEV